MERQFARLLNSGGELIAEGSCHVEEGEQRATLEAEREPGEVLKVRGDLTISLESGASFAVADRPVVFRIAPRAQASGHQPKRTLYRFNMRKLEGQGVAGGGSAER
jgi:hypothetical protein